MPYIKHRREEFEPAIQTLKNLIYQAGELNYVITRLIHNFVALSEDGPCYESYNRVMGVLECAKAELYRRKIAPYEDEAIIRNGDV